jgi:lipopolysaccharide transport system ATP-binding protein
MSSSSQTSDFRSPISSSDSDSDVLIKVDNVSKKFCRDFKKSLWYGLKDTAADILHPKHESQDSKLRLSEFWANQNISFELKRGECLGLIGHNGAGKTTLLKMLNGLIKPDTGSIEMRGRIGALIALGAGFNPILTGRENIYINGSVLGLTRKEIDAKIDGIINFAEIEDAIDAPVRTYSSGMQVRLGFAVATSLKPDILILDEVLAVGDAAFVVKCLNRVRDLAQNCAIIFVSHQMQHVSNFCTRVIVMDQGISIMDTINPGDGINCYFGQMKFSGNETGTGTVDLERFKMIINGNAHDSNPEIKPGEELEVELNLLISPMLNQAHIRLMIDDEAQTPVITYPIVDRSCSRVSFSSGTHQIKIPLGLNDLNAGSYSFRVIIADANSGFIHMRKSCVSPFRVKSDDLAWSKIVRPVMIEDVKIDKA